MPSISGASVSVCSVFHAWFPVHVSWVSSCELAKKTAPPNRHSLSRIDGVTLPVILSNQSKLWSGREQAHNAAQVCLFVTLVISHRVNDLPLFLQLWSYEKRPTQSVHIYLEVKLEKMYTLCGKVNFWVGIMCRFFIFKK